MRSWAGQGRHTGSQQTGQDSVECLITIKQDKHMHVCIKNIDTIEKTPCNKKKSAMYIT